MINIHRSDSV